MVGMRSHPPRVNLTGPSSAKGRREKKPSAWFGPAHQIVDALVFLGDEAEAAVEPHCRIMFLDMDRDVLARSRRLIHQVAQQRLAGALASMLGQEGDIDDTVLARPA